MATAELSTQKTTLSPEAFARFIEVLEHAPAPSPSMFEMTLDYMERVAAGLLLTDATTPSEAIGWLEDHGYRPRASGEVRQPGLARQDTPDALLAAIQRGVASVCSDGNSDARAVALDVIAEVRAAGYRIVPVSA